MMMITKEVLCIKAYVVESENYVSKCEKIYIVSNKIMVKN
jgi:hypothetical protein